jgi:hypothetical protein
MENDSMNNETSAQKLWYLAQAAMDEGRAPEQDEAILDLLLEEPELMETMDEVLLVTAQVKTIANLPVNSHAASRLPSRIRMATVAAAVMISCLPFLGDETNQQLSSPGPGRVTIATVGEEQRQVDSGTAELAGPEGLQPIPAQVLHSKPIPSFTASVKEIRPPVPGPNPRNANPTFSRPQIVTLTSTRTKIALGSHNR